MYSIPGHVAADVAADNVVDDDVASTLSAAHGLQLLYVN